MYGLLIPVGVDPAVADALERYAEGVEGMVEQAVAAVLEMVRDNVKAELRDFLLGLEDVPTADERDRILTVIEDTIGHADEYDPFAVVDVLSVGEFMREEVGRGMVVDGVMALDDRLMALADNGASKHRRVEPRQPKRYNTKVLQGPW